MRSAFHVPRYQLIRETPGGFWPRKIFSRITLCRKSENALLCSRKTCFMIDLHCGVESITPTSNQFCTTMEDKTLIVKVEILLLASLVR